MEWHESLYLRAFINAADLLMAIKHQLEEAQMSKVVHHSARPGGPLQLAWLCAVAAVSDSTGCQSF